MLGQAIVNVTCMVVGTFCIGMGSNWWLAAGVLFIAMYLFPGASRR